jgi:tetratricopeptide (TPR) repeat protein
MASREEVPWLIKSSGRILGPFHSSKIIDLLRSREVSVLDEVSEPLRRWQTIQYHADFKEVVDNLRRANVSDKTEATWTPTSVTSNLTQTLTDLGDDELTQEITNSLSGFTNTAKEIVIHNVQEQTHTSHPLGAGRFSTAQGQSTAIQRQVESTTRGLWIVTMVVLLAVAAFIVQKRMSHIGTVAPTSLSSLKQVVMADVQTGQYAEALRELKAFFPDPSQSGEMAIYFGSLLVQVEGQTVLGRRILNQVIAQHRPEIKQAYTSQGVADLMDGQLDSAQDNFDKALAIDPGYNPAIVNAASVALQRGDYMRAKNLALKALQLVPLQGEALLALAEAQLYLFKGNSSHNDLNTVGKMIKQFRSKQWDYSAELGFYSLYFDFLRQDRDFEERLTAYLDQDPELTQDHRHNVFIYKGHTQWKILGRLCEQMAERLGDGPRVSTLLASCFGHEGRWDQARRAIEKSVQQAPKDSLIQAWFSYVLKQSSEANQASVVLGHASEYNRKGEFVLPILLQARFCAASEDIECARESWQRIYERDLDNLPAVSGLAWVNAQKGSRSEANKLMEKGLKISPDYIPLLLLRLKAEREGWYAAN